MDYSLITKWKNREIPKEVILKGINRAFEDSKLRDGQGEVSIRNLKQCVRYVESSIEEFRPVINMKDDSFDKSETLQPIIEELNKHIREENTNVNRNYYIDIKERILSINDDNPFGQISRIEEESLQQLFMNLDQVTRDEIIEEAIAKLGSRARRMTDEAIEESTISFRNEIITSKFNLKGILSIAEGRNE